VVRLRLFTALVLVLLAALPGVAQGRMVAITASQGWTWWWAPSSLQAVVLEAATRAAELRGWRVVSRPAQGIAVLSLSVAVSDEDVTSRGDWAVGTARVTVRAELVAPDGAVWRSSRASLALWLVRPFRTSREAALERAARAAASEVTVEALERLEGRQDAGADGVVRGASPSLACDTWRLGPNGERMRGPEANCP
jgi:hypothetical protein